MGKIALNKLISPKVFKCAFHKTKYKIILSLAWFAPTRMNETRPQLGLQRTLFATQWIVVKSSGTNEIETFSRFWLWIVARLLYSLCSNNKINTNCVAVFLNILIGKNLVYCPERNSNPSLTRFWSRANQTYNKADYWSFKATGVRPNISFIWKCISYEVSNNYRFVVLGLRLHYKKFLKKTQTVIQLFSFLLTQKKKNSLPKAGLKPMSFCFLVKHAYNCIMRDHQVVNVSECRSFEGFHVRIPRDQYFFHLRMYIPFYEVSNDYRVWRQGKIVLNKKWCSSVQARP